MGDGFCGYAVFGAASGLTAACCVLGCCRLRSWSLALFDQLRLRVHGKRLESAHGLFAAFLFASWFRIAISFAFFFTGALIEGISRHQGALRCGIVCMAFAKGASPFKIVNRKPGFFFPKQLTFQWRRIPMTLRQQIPCA